MLYKAGEGKLGTDESKFNQFLCVQSYEQLQALFNEYRNVSSKTDEKAIKSEMSGDLEDGMLAIGTESHKYMYNKTYPLATILRSYLIGEIFIEEYIATKLNWSSHRNK